MKTYIKHHFPNTAQSFSSSKQGVIAVSVGNQTAETEIILKDKNGKEILSLAPEHSFQAVILSTPELKSGETYTVSVGSKTSNYVAS